MSQTQSQLKEKIQKSKLQAIHGAKYNPFQKSEQEKGILAKMKKKHNRMFFGLFSTKRPTAGIVRRHFSQS